MAPQHSTDALTDVVVRLNNIWLPYMITGSIAARFYGLNRATEDTDIVIDIRSAMIDDFVAAFHGDYYVDREMVTDSVRTGMMFNLISLSGGGKFDMIPLKDAEPFEQYKFERRRSAEWRGYPVWIADPADLVLSKLAWAKETRSTMQLADVRVIMASGEVDESGEEFLRWLHILDLSDVLDAARTTRHDD